MTVLQKHETQNLSRENTPEYFTEGSYFNYMNNPEAPRTFKNKSEVILMNTGQAAESRYIRAQVHKCTGEDCATDEEISEFLKDNYVSTGSIQVFINYEEVEPGKDPVKKFTDFIESR